MIMEKLVITVAMVGAETTLEQQPNLPITAEQIGEEAENCRRAGASMIHLHVRDEKGNPTQSKDYFQPAIDEIRRRTDLLVQVSTGGAVGMTPEERLNGVYCEPKPDMATLSCGTVNFGNEVFWNSPDLIESFARHLAARGVKPEIEVFDVGMISNAENLVKKGLIKPPLHFDFVMGVTGGISGDPFHLMHLIKSIPPGSTWTVAGIGRHQLPLAVMAIILGGHVRVGFEDNIYYSKGILAQSNAQLVERIVRIAGELGREIATPTEARQILGL